MIDHWTMWRISLIFDIWVTGTQSIKTEILSNIAFTIMIAFQEVMDTNSLNVDYSGRARSKTWTVFAPSNNAVVCSNPTSGMDVSVRLFCVCVVLCLGSGLTTGWSLIQGVVFVKKWFRNWIRSQGPEWAGRAIVNNAADHSSRVYTRWAERVMQHVTNSCSWDGGAIRNSRSASCRFLLRTQRLSSVLVGTSALPRV
jgi:hypothetical protein